MLKRLFPFGLCLTMVAGMVAGCSSTKHSSAPATDGSAGPPLKIGVVCSCSGTYGPYFAGSIDVYRAWDQSIDAAGGINGHQVQLLYEDDKSDPATSTTEVKTLITDHVVALVDLSVVDQTWETTIDSAKIPVVGGNITETPFYSDPNFYPSGETEDAATNAVIEIAKKAGASNIGQLYCAEAPICAEGVPAFEADAKRIGIPDVYNGSIAATAPNYTAQCVAAEEAHATSLFIGDNAPVVDRVGANCHQQGYNPIYVIQGNGFSMIEASAPGIKDNLWAPYNDEPFFAQTPAVEAMNAAVDKYYPGLRKNATTYTGESTLVWASGLLLEAAVKAGGLGSLATPSADEIVTGLESLKGETLGGISPPLTFAPGKPHPVDCFFTAHVSNGIPSTALNNQVTCVSGASS